MDEIKNVFTEISKITEKNISETIEKHSGETARFLLKMELVKQMENLINSSCIDLRKKLKEVYCRMII